jgi:transcriptional regulator with XRE-family HTH domain
MRGKSRKKHNISGDSRGRGKRKKAKNEKIPLPGYALRVRAALKRMGWSQADLARALHKHYNTVNAWLNGASKPAPEQLGEIADALNTSVDELLGRDLRTAERMRAICEHADYIKALATQVKPTHPAPPPPAAEEPPSAGAQANEAEPAVAKR